MYAGPENGWIDKAMGGWKQRENGIVRPDTIQLFHYMGKNPDDPTSQDDAGYHYALTKGNDGSYRVDNADYSGGLRAQDTDNNNRFNLSEFAVKAFLGAALGGAAGFGPLAGGNAAGAIGSGEGSLASQWAAMGANGVPTLTMGEGAAAGGGLLGDAAQGFRTGYQGLQTAGLPPADPFSTATSTFGQAPIGESFGQIGSGTAGQAGAVASGAAGAGYVSPMATGSILSTPGLSSITPSALADFGAQTGLNTAGLSTAAGLPYSGTNLQDLPKPTDWKKNLNDVKKVLDATKLLTGGQDQQGGEGAGLLDTGAGRQYSPVDAAFRLKMARNKQMQGLLQESPIPINYGLLGGSNAYR